MALAEEFEKTGNWLFRHRSYMPLALFAVAIPVIAFKSPELVSFHRPWWNITCFGISMFGLLIRALTIGFTPRNTSGRNTSEGQVADELNTSGIYSMVRHPLYVGNLFMWLGLILYVGTPWFIMLSVAFFWIYYERIMFAEEQYIRGKFGNTFVEWAAVTPAFIPDFRKWKKASLAFSFRNILKREYSGFFGSVFSFCMLNFLKNLFYDGQLWLDTEWQIGGVAGLVIYLTLRTLTKHTRAFHTEGR